MLYAEFNSRSVDGKIKIPDEYESFNAKPLKVILILDEEVQQPDAVGELFEAFDLDLSNFAFNRDEANER
jgi:hypothetical protein